MAIPCLPEQEEVDGLKPQDVHPRPKPNESHPEILKYLRLVPQAAEPNLGRVCEIKEELKAGKYPTREIIEEAAARLAIRFLRKE